MAQFMVVGWSFGPGEELFQRRVPVPDQTTEWHQLYRNAMAVDVSDDDAHQKLTLRPGLIPGLIANFGGGLLSLSLFSLGFIRYSGSNVVADVAYDMFLGSSPGGYADYEVMIWLAALGGTGPISSTTSPIATTPDIAGVSWSLYAGYNGSMKVYSFVAPSEQNQFNGDIMGFFDYLETAQGVSKDQFLQRFQAGTEAFTGTDADFTTSSYSIAMR